MLTRKHFVSPTLVKRSFELIAEAMAGQVVQLGYKETCEALADALATSNPAFNRDRFLKACGVF